MRCRTFLLLFWSLFFVPVINGQTVYTDRVFDSNIKSVLLYANGDQLADPVIKLGTRDVLTLSFDDLSNRQENYKYTLIHCTSDWQPSTLNPSDYLSGYFEGEIRNYKFSFNTLTPYIHYVLNFPNTDISLKLSGNYIIKVYLDDGGDTTVMFTRRFFVVEPLVSVAARVPYYPQNLSYFKIRQEVDLTCSAPDIFSAEPEQRFKITVQQNGRWDNAYYNLHPTSVTPSQLLFRFPDGITFNSGNEPRYFDMKDFWYQSEYIARITQQRNDYDVILHTGYPRTGRQYETYKDNHGKMFIAARSDQNPNTEGDYAQVYFSLKMPQMKNGDVYILGQLTDWQLNTRSKMTYNPQKEEYEAHLFLKQGYYEYWYAFLPAGSVQANITPIEGSYWETRNTYTIYVYYHSRVMDYDRLVGIRKINAH
ncbi:DUF5103 domain-containing protein [Candidatus Sulfidibacterium hydrothermale]|uniref:type IX secretion system plug protein n=1 Tax=Candidatus Sulfidibacterium hydrothermale TaxID=2875962 RepID=UPI001F0ABD76|nr:DUF5103 domain-containing protein [Candidatus Sulfidibacterium hydrothermale]UBM61803.1 DUF5103 domain-containing protein [Candidatus Sulfidibacterium hydrothermale]